MTQISEETEQHIEYNLTHFLKKRPVVIYLAHKAGEVDIRRPQVTMIRQVKFIGLQLVILQVQEFHRVIVQ